MNFDRGSRSPGLEPVFRDTQEPTARVSSLPKAAHGFYSCPRACVCGAKFLSRDDYWACRLSHEETHR